MSSRTAIAAAAVITLSILGTTSIARGEVAPPSTPVYRYSTGPLFFYDNSPVPPAGFTVEGNVFYTLPAGTADTVPFRRFYSGTAGHFYSTVDEGLVGFTDDCNGCTIGNIATKQLDGTVPLFRLRHPTDRNYFYTISDSERAARLDAGWRSEGTAGYVYDTNRSLQIGPTTLSQYSYYYRSATINRALGATLEVRLAVPAESALRTCNSTRTNQPCRDVVIGDIAVNGAHLSFATSDQWTAIVQIGADRILAGKSSFATNDAAGVPIFDETQEHTYRIVVPAAVGTTSPTTFQLYIDGAVRGTTTNGVFKASNFALIHTDGYLFKSKDRIVFGESTNAASVTSQWKHVRFANAPGVPGADPAWTVAYGVDLGLPAAGSNGWTYEVAGTTPPTPTIHYTKPAAAADIVSQSAIHRHVKGNYLYSTRATGEATGYALEGNYFGLLPAGPNTVPLHRYKRDDVGYYLGTTSPVDAKSSTGILNRWTHEGSLGWISTVARAGLVPLYRYLLQSGGGKGTHFYTTVLANVQGVTYEKIVGYVVPVDGVTEPAPP